MTNKISLALVISMVALLSACGGGGGGGGTPVADPTNSTKVTPSLGQFSAGTVVNLAKPDSTLLSTGSILADGTVTLTYPASYTGPIVVTVVGGANVKYFDESTGLDTVFGLGSSLRAVLPAPQTQVGVTALTNAAVENLAAAGGIANASAATVNDANAKVAAVFGLTDILVAPTPVSASTGKALDLASPGDKYALVLAAFAKAAPTGTNAAAFAVTLALDLKDGKLDAKDGRGSTPNATLSNPVTSTALVTAYQSTAATYATAESEIVAATMPLTVTADVTSVVPVSNQSDVTLAKALFSELRTTLISFSNGNATGFLDTKVNSIKNDVNANVAPELSREIKRIAQLNYATTLFEEAKALADDSHTNFDLGTDPDDITKQTLNRTSGTKWSAWLGNESFKATLNKYRQNAS